MVFVALVSAVMCYAQLETREIIHDDTTRKYLEYIQASLFVTIKLNETSISGDIKIYNSTGKLVQTISPEPQHIQLNVSGMPVGMYYVCTSTGKIMHKLVVTR